MHTHHTHTPHTHSCNHSCSDLCTFIIDHLLGTFVLAQWLRLRAASAGRVGSIPGQEPRPLMPCGAARRVKKKRKTTTPNPPFLQTISYSSRHLLFCLFHSLLIVKNLAPLIDNIVHKLRNLGIYSVYPASQPHQLSPPPWSPATLCP